MVQTQRPDLEALSAELVYFATVIYSPLIQSKALLWPCYTYDSFKMLVLCHKYCSNFLSEG